MRKINRIFIHCSASPEGRPDTVDAIRNWHTMPKPQGRGWSDIGYHYVIELDGAKHAGRPLKRPGAGARGHNDDSIHICYIGGMDSKNERPKDTRTPAQVVALAELVEDLRARFPGAEVLGHRDVDRGKACPSFDARAEFAPGKAQAR